MSDGGKLVVARCGQCGAAFESRPDEDGLVQCGYCNALSRLQRRKGLLERKQPLPPVRGREKLPVSVEKLSTRFWAGGGILLFQPIAVVAILMAFHHNKKWDGSDPLLLADCNGDGVADAIGRRVMIDRLWGGTDHRVIAVDGKSGEILWTSERLGKDATSPHGFMVLSGEVLVYAHRTDSNHKGPSLGLSLKTGEVLWRGKYIDYTQTICDVSLPDGRSRIYFGGRESVMVDPSTGEQTPVDDAGQTTMRKKCVPARSTEPGAMTDLETTGVGQDWQGFTTSSAFRRRGVDEPWIVSGRQLRGKTALWLARVKADSAKSFRTNELDSTLTLLWKKELVSRGRIDPSMRVAMDDQRAYAFYQDIDEEEVRVLGVSLTDGSIAWDVAIDYRDYRTVVARDGRLYLSAEYELYILDGETGREIANRGTWLW